MAQPRAITLSWTTAALVYELFGIPSDTYRSNRLRQDEGGILLTCTPDQNMSSARLAQTPCVFF